MDFLIIPLNSGQTLVNGSSVYIGNSSNHPCQMACMSDIPVQYVHPTTKVCNYSYTHPSTKQCSWVPDTSGFGKSVLLSNQSINNYSPYGSSNSPIVSITLEKRYPMIYFYLYLTTSGSTTISENHFYLNSTIGVPSNQIYIYQDLYGIIGDLIDISNCFMYTSNARKSGSNLPTYIEHYYSNGVVSFPFNDGETTINLMVWTSYPGCENMRLNGSIRVVALDL